MLADIQNKVEIYIKKYFKKYIKKYNTYLKYYKICFKKMSKTQT